MHKYVISIQRYIPGEKIRFQLAWCSFWNEFTVLSIFAAPLKMKTTANATSKMLKNRNSDLTTNGRLEFPLYS